jgi:hypothetical protein
VEIIYQELYSRAAIYHTWNQDKSAIRLFFSLDGLCYNESRKQKGLRNTLGASQSFFYASKHDDLPHPGLLPLELVSKSTVKWFQIKSEGMPCLRKKKY